MRLDRRQALSLFGLGLASSGCAAAAPADAMFGHGVASGDPLADRVILWTRVTPNGAGPVAGTWEMATAPDFRSLVRQGRFSTGGDRDWTVKLDVDGLAPGQDYYYRFKVGTAASAVGRTRTLPVGPTRDVVIAAACCALYPGGYFNAYQAIADLPRVDVVLHLGDYIYEHAADGYGSKTGEKLGRLVQPAHEIVSLDDYRTRHAQARADAKLQAAHARAPWIVVWDDHETANNSWEYGAENHQPATEGDWATRKAVAIKAYFEWMPIREPQPGRMRTDIWRSFQFGDLASLMMLETRLSARTEQLDYSVDLPKEEGGRDVEAFQARRWDPQRRMMGPGQEDWLAGELARSVRSGQVWQVIGNQVVMARVNAPDYVKVMGQAAFDALLGRLSDSDLKSVKRTGRLAALDLPYNLDSWDGYPADRERFYAACAAAQARPILLSGDSHAFWANDLADGKGRRRAAEFGATGVTSPGYADRVPKALPVGEAFAASNPEVLFQDSAAKGFVLLTLTRKEARADLMAVSTIMKEAYTSKVLASFSVAPTRNGVGPVRRV